VEAAAAVAGWEDALAALEFFHAGYHFQLVRAAIVFFLLGRFWGWEEGRWRAWDCDGGCRCLIVQTVVCWVGGSGPRQRLGVDWGCCVIVTSSMAVCSREESLHQVRAGGWRGALDRLPVDYCNVVGVGVREHKLGRERVWVLLGVLTLGTVGVDGEKPRWRSMCRAVTVDRTVTIGIAPDVSGRSRLRM
jgi:hypothetical protein